MILGINTASEEVSIALFEPKKIEKEISWRFYATQSRELLPKIDQLLKKNRVKLSDLEAIAVYQGPGSYTGLRVGISIANTMAWALDIPLVGIKNQKSKITPRLRSRQENKKRNSINYPGALEIAKRADKIFKNKKLKRFDKTQRRKFSKIVIPYYGSQLK